MQEKTNYKLILAVLQGDDYHEVVYQLNQKGYYAPLLHSSGGFLKKRSMTIMMGVEADKLEGALEILKERAGKRMETVLPPAVAHSMPTEGVIPAIPVQMPCGGVTVFVLDMDNLERY